MNNISIELKTFFETTGIHQCELAKRSNVSTATISRIVKGVQKDVKLSTANALRVAMASLRNNHSIKSQKHQEHA